MFVASLSYEPPIRTSRFCDTAGKILTERELIDFSLFREEAAHMTFEQKKEVMRQRGGLYPECCMIGDVRDMGDLKKSWIIETDQPQPHLEPPHYTLHLYADKREEKGIYEHTFVSLNACGGQFFDSRSGFDITEAEYKRMLDIIKRHTEGDK